MVDFVLHDLVGNFSYASHLHKLNRRDQQKYQLPEFQLFLENFPTFLNLFGAAILARSRDWKRSLSAIKNSIDQY